jgi:hypothetical protein
MGRHTGSSTQRESSVSKPKQPHEIWRGIGCLMMVVVPIISIAAAHATIKFMLDIQTANQMRLIPYQLLGYPHLPDIAYKLSGLRTILEPLTKIKNLYADAVVSIVYMILISGVISVAYAAVYRMANPNRYGPTDAPPLKTRKVKKSR